jgi:prepilin-type N-terminal cleavage/methylation domain-containing protein
VSARWSRATVYDESTVTGRRPRMTSQAGFTLIELLIIIVILGILAATVIFALSGVSSNSAISACNADAKSVELAAETYHTQTGNWPTLSSQLIGSGNEYLRSWPNNPDHYSVSLAANGEVDVQPFNGTGGTLPAPYNTPVNYDTTPNPCTAVK